MSETSTRQAPRKSVAMTLLSLAAAESFVLTLGSAPETATEEAVYVHLLGSGQCLSEGPYAETSGAPRPDIDEDKQTATLSPSALASNLPELHIRFHKQTDEFGNVRYFEGLDEVTRLVLQQACDYSPES